MAAESVNEDVVDLFKEEFKKYKRRKPPPDFSELIDFTDLSSSKKEKYGIQKLDIHQPESIPRLPGLQEADAWIAHDLSSFPGFVHISNPFTPEGQRYWVYRCIHDYPTKPNVTNLDFIEEQLGKERPRNLWEAFSGSHPNKLSKKPKLSLNENNLNEEERSKLNFDKLRWVTLGYHYNWDSKTYNENKKSDFPSDLSVLAKYIAGCVVGQSLPFNAEAAIINYYHLDSTLAGHTDHSEFDHNAPIISISFGQDAVFLLGGVTKAVRPVAVHLRSGDVCIMSRSTRLSYHAVPRVFESTSFKSSFEINANQPEADSCANDGEKYKIKMGLNKTSKIAENTADNPVKIDFLSVIICDKIQELQKDFEWNQYQEHLEKGRINISIRQVLKEGQLFPPNQINSGKSNLNTDTHTEEDTQEDTQIAVIANNLKNEILIL